MQELKYYFGQRERDSLIFLPDDILAILCREGDWIAINKEAKGFCFKKTDKYI